MEASANGWAVIITNKGGLPETVTNAKIMKTLTAKSLEKNIVELAENSKINIKNTNILIDRGIIDYNQNKFEVFGNFYLY